MDADISTGEEMADSGLGTAEINAGAGPAPMPTTVPGGSAGSPAATGAGA